ncbi:hypothetical protein B0S93_1477 [Caldicellulosiruptor bescii]|nr:hypothetical protein B0S93_1477 [Caldicellulosiruptor bescii]
MVIKIFKFILIIVIGVILFLLSQSVYCYFYFT